MAAYWMFEPDRQFGRRHAMPDPEATAKHLALPPMKRIRRSEMLMAGGCVQFHPSREPDELQFFVKARALGLLKP